MSIVIDLEQYSVKRVVVEKSLVIACLQEISDIDYQREVWILGADNQVTGFDDVIAGLFDGSLLGKALESNDIIFSEHVDNMLRILNRKIAVLPVNLITKNLIELPKWKEIAELAKQINESIN